MGVDIYFSSEKKDFEARLYHLTGIIKEFSWQYHRSLPELVFGKKLNSKEKKQLLQFLKFVLPNIEKQKQKELAKLESKFSKAVLDINQKTEELISYLKSTKVVDKKMVPKLTGLIKRLENLNVHFGNNPDLLREEIKQNYQEKIELVKKMDKILTSIVKIGGQVEIN